ncbi:hypothetical protein AB0I30_23205 [Nocardia tengchongensis]|uniref:hypothetical protein n=1 Tax=Nocardia tengchongensis TaxID=2055889 RepID=UPI003402284A
MTVRNASIYDANRRNEKPVTSTARGASDRAEKIPKVALAAVVTTLQAAYRHGMTPTLEQIAGELGQTIGSGAFRIRMAACAHHGVIEPRRGRVEITELGVAVLEEATGPAALVEAWLNVWVYNEIYTLFDGKPLPVTDTDFEDELLRIGVPRKRCVDVRRKLLAGADTAGIFTEDRDRLVLPMLPPHTPRTASTPSSMATAVAAAPDSTPPTISAPAPNHTAAACPIAAPTAAVAPNPDSVLNIAGAPSADEMIAIGFGEAGGITVGLGVRWFKLPAHVRTEIFAATDRLIAIADAYASDGPVQGPGHNLAAGSASEPGHGR